uniref:FAD-dependent monooxygenase n=1 Tax=Paractinoplanes polyasparticus TaxID=2856853 RepID=UPI001C849195|nr:FAD-dependent monooxygenase [Actinoplanes polyasparticus]
MKVAIIGAGITGLTLAAALRRAGITCCVFERAASFRRIGAGIQLSPNAVRLLRRLGLDTELAGTAVRSDGVEVRHWKNGNVVSWIPLGDDCERLFGAPYYLMHRADLHNALVDLVPAGSVHLGSTCVEVIERDNGAQVVFADGSNITVDVVVGADGIGSTVRGSSFADEPHYSGQTVYRGLAPATAQAPFRDGERKSVIWVGEGKHVVSYPVAAGSLINIVAVTADEAWSRESWSTPARVGDARAAFAGWDTVVLDLISAADSLTKWGLHLRSGDFPWSGQFVTLAGDAAHPMLPFLAQGANQGIEDAMTLAGCLSQATFSDATLALQRYEQLRRPRVSAIQQYSAKPPTSQGTQALLDTAWIFGHDPLSEFNDG